MEFNGESTVEVSAKKKLNGTVNPSGTVQVFANSGDRSREFLGEWNFDIVPMEVLGDTVGSNNQKVQGNGSENNGTLVLMRATTVNPTLGLCIICNSKLSQKL